MATPAMKLETDPLSCAILYLRLWKMCQMKLEGTAQESGVRWFDVIPPPDEHNMITDFRRLIESQLEWAEAADRLRSDIAKVLEFCTKEVLTGQDLSRIVELQKDFDEKVLHYSQEVTIVGAEKVRAAVAAAY